MRIGWLIPGIGIFGSVREVVENSNVLVDQGHAVTIYHPSGLPCPWLPCRALTAKLDDAADADLDVIIKVGNPREYLDILHYSNAPLKAVCLMGFTECVEDLAFDEGMKDLAESGYAIMVDSSWQADMLREMLGTVPLAVIGGVNVEMFRPVHIVRKPTTRRILWSGDPRSRKGGATVEAALEIVKAGRTDIVIDSYFTKNLLQERMAEYLSNADMFVDGHTRGGWCNPVIEALACGTPVVCTNIGATRDFALHEQTALTVPPNDPQAMAEAINRLLGDEELRVRLARGGYKRVQRFDYKVIGVRLEDVLLNALEIAL